MQRKKLEQIEPMLATEEMIQLVESDVPERKVIHWTFRADEVCYKYSRYIFFRAKPLDGILYVAMYLRADIKNGITLPYFNIFLDKEKREFATYNLREGKWSNAKIDMLNFPQERGMDYENIPYADTVTTAHVNAYFGTEKKSVRNLILDFQWSIRKEQLSQKYRSEMDEIDVDMELIPKVPADFEDWAIEYGLYTQRYIMYHAEKRRNQQAYCVQCGSSIVVQGAKRDKEIRCPVCKRIATALPWTAQNIRHDVDVALMQRLTDDSGWVVRRFRVLMFLNKQDNWKPKHYICEEVREIYSDDLHRMQHYEYGCYKASGVVRWCYEANEPSRKGYYRNDFELRDVRLYWKNLCKERKGTILQYIPLEKLLRKRPGCYIDIRDMMWNLRNHPEIEYFIKMGFNRLSFDILNSEIALKEGKKPWQVLGVSKATMELARKWDVSHRQLETMRAVEELGHTLTRSEMEFFTTYFHKDVKKILRYATPHKMYRYFTEVLENARDYGDYWDYLEAAAINQYDMRSDMVLFPRHFRQAHDNAIEERRIREKKIQDMDIMRKNREYAKMVPGIKALYEFEDDTFFIKVPEKKSDFTKEGHMNNNCVSTYFDRVVKGQCVVVFLRKKELPDQSYCTVEITDIADIRQLRSRYNREAPEEAKEFAKKWMKEVNKRKMRMQKVDTDRAEVPVAVG